MFVWSIKASTIKLAGIVVLSAVTLALIIAILPHSLTETASIGTGTTVQSSKTDYSEMKTEDDFLKFINQFGIEVEPTPVEVVDVQIPNKFDAVMQKYNIVQNLQGFDLKKYRNKTVTRHTYKLKNEASQTADSPERLLSILVYRDKIIGGDICSQENGGVVSGFVDYKKQS